jgi:hypothetical protein
MDEIKRGPGRPRKEPAPEMSESAAPITPVQRYKVTHYKVRTSQGRKIQGQFVELPASEGDEFVRLGHMKLSDPEVRQR